MKTNIKILAASLIAAGFGLSACQDLDTLPGTSYVSTEQKEEVINSNPEMATAGVVGIASTYTPYDAVYTTHIDFGWPSVMLLSDASTADMVGFNTGYNWFSSGGTFDYGNNNNYFNNLTWYHAFKVIRSSNAVLASIPADTDNKELMLYAAQGYANRAFMYFQLAQYFQYTYKGHESLPCVPVITNENADQAAADGAPRATVQEVYDQILSDLGTAIDLLTKSGLSTSIMADTGAKRFVSLGTAYGIRARVNLVMNNWTAAAADARSAITSSGATPASIAEVSCPSFWSSDDNNWMWCVYVSESDDVVQTGIINFPSHMGSLNYGYASVGAWRRINKTLYNSIPESDVRKGWFLDDAAVSANLNPTQQAYLSGHGAPAYTQVKFAPYQNVVDQTVNASDIPLMRVEEMYLIEAEATAMAGNAAAGKSLLESFIQTYRNPSYTCSASTPAAVQEEVWMQRRVELWGEGIAYTDLLRLNKGIDRRGGGWPTEWVYNVPAPLKPLLIPQNEMQNNSKIGDNNETWGRPSPVDDYE